MRLRHLALSALAIAVLVADRSLAAQAASPAVAADSLAFRRRLLELYDERSGDPLDGVEVRDLYSGTTALTTATGTVSLAFLPAGRTLVSVRKIGYLPRTVIVTISPTDTAALTVLLTPQSTTLPTVTTTDSSTRRLPPVVREFEARRKVGQGRFIDEAQLRARDGQQMSTVLAVLSGLTIRAGMVVGTHGTSPGPVILSGGKPCFATIYQDGALISHNAPERSTALDAAPDFSRLGADQYAAIEFYASPGEYPPSIGPNQQRLRGTAALDAKPLIASTSRAIPHPSSLIPSAPPKTSSDASTLPSRT